MEELATEARNLLARLHEVDIPTGDSVMVSYDQKWSEKHGVGHYGRMTLKGGVRTFHVAPAKVDREVKYEHTPHHFFDFAKDWVQGTIQSVPVDKFIQGPEWPQEIKPRPPMELTYEAALFGQLTAAGPVTLVNPSFKTMNLLLEHGGYVTLTSQEDMEWHHSVRDYVKKSRGRLKILPMRTVKGTAYLGTNVPKWYPVGQPWVRLIHSPYIDPAGNFANYSVKYYDKYVVSRFQKKDNYEVVSTLSRDTSQFVYNPMTVDETLFPMAKKQRRLFFMESSHALTVTEVEDTRVAHSPWFVDGDGHWVTMQSKDGIMATWKVRGMVVLDVRGQGTYLSRRSRMVPPEGYSWTPLLQKGTHWVTYSSNQPSEMYGVRKYKLDNLGMPEVVTFENTTPVQKLVSAIAPMGLSFSHEPKGTFSWRLLSDDPMYLNEGEDGYRQAWMDKLGRMFLPSQKTDSGAFFTPSPHGHDHVPLLGQGTVVQVPVFSTSKATYVDCTQVTDDSFVFSSLGEMNKVTSIMTVFSQRWASFTSLSMGLQDPDYGGAITHDTLVYQIHAYMKEHVIAHHIDPGVSSTQVAKKTGCSLVVAHRYLSRLPDYYVWRVGGLDKTEFVPWIAWM